jgi:hypothetical protein
MADRIIWCGPLFLGVMFVFSCLAPPQPKAKWYLRGLVGAVGMWLIFLSAHHVFRPEH